MGITHVAWLEIRARGRHESSFRRRRLNEQRRYETRMSAAESGSVHGSLCFSLVSVPVFPATIPVGSRGARHPSRCSAWEIKKIADFTSSCR